MQQAELIPVSTIGELRRSKTLDGNDSLKKALTYYDTLAQTTATNIDAWPAQVVVAGEQKRTINKKFFAMKEEAEKPQISEETMKRIDLALKSSGGFISQRKQRLQAEVNSLMRNANDYYANFEDRLRRAFQLRQELMSLDGKEIDIKGEILKILQSGFWELVDQYAGTLCFGVVPEIVLTCDKPKARVPMGRYLAQLEIQNGTVRVHPKDYGGNNLFTGSIYHPYVSGDGQVCWGNASDTASKLISTGQFAKVFELLANLITTYDITTTPYATLADFQTVYQRRVTGNTRAYCGECDEERAECGCGDWCGTCDRHTDDCSCFYCEVCERGYQGSRCEQHWCRICRDYSTDCGCCERCERSESDCECCSDCGSLDENCDRCRECDMHEGEHEGHCSHATVEVDEDANF